MNTKFFILAVGCLSAAAINIPPFPGIEKYKGAFYHTSHWPEEVINFSGKKVAVIGTGSSGVQIIPLIAQEAEQLTVFQRTANFCIPARNRPIDDKTRTELKQNYDKRREKMRHMNLFSGNQPHVSDTPMQEVLAKFEEGWKIGGAILLIGFGDLLNDEKANKTIADFVRGKIHEIVHDPKVAEKLTPKGFPLGAKRICIGTDYYETFNRPNVLLIDVNETPIVEIVPEGIRTSAKTFEFDAIISATGFDAMTGAILGIDIRGRNNESLRDKWATGPQTYLGVATAGFPNMFIIAGPGSPSVIGNMVISIEQHVEWIANLMEYMRFQGLKTIEADINAEKSWVTQVSEAANRTLFPKATNSYYLGANIPGKPRVFMPYVGGVGNYRKLCESIAANHYEGFVFTNAKHFEKT